MDEEKQIAPPAPLTFSIESLWKRVLGRGVKEKFIEMNEGLEGESGLSEKGRAIPDTK